MAEVLLKEMPRMPLHFDARFSLDDRVGFSGYDERTPAWAGHLVMLALDLLRRWWRLLRRRPMPVIQTGRLNQEWENSSGREGDMGVR